MMARVLALLSLGLVGCAADGTYPSLAPRPIERTSFDEPPPRPTPVVADPALDRQVAEMGARLDAIVQGFDRAAAEAERRGTAARGRAAGSEPWLEAQTALAALDDWRAQASALGTDVEQLAIGRAAALAPPYPALAALGDRTATESERQDSTIARLQAQLAPA